MSDVDPAPPEPSGMRAGMVALLVGAVALLAVGGTVLVSNCWVDGGTFGCFTPEPSATTAAAPAQDAPDEPSVADREANDFLAAFRTSHPTDQDELCRLWYDMSTNLSFIAYEEAFGRSSLSLGQFEDMMVEACGRR